MRRGRPRHPELLTPREQEVLSLIREGLTNEQIAERLGISESGARYHVSEILSKLGVQSRQEAAAWVEPAPRRGMPAALGTCSSGLLVAGGAAIAVIALVSLVLGVVWLTDDDGASPRSSSEPPDASDEGLGALLGLAAEAELEARSVLPDPYLYAVAYPETSGLYTFRFREPDGLREVGVVGPYANDPSFPLWELFEDTLPPGSPVPEPLDLTKLNQDFGDIMDAVRAHQSYFGELALVLWVEDGEIRWLARPAVSMSPNRAYPFECTGSDSQNLDASIICEPPTRTP